jgi:hypothetical protein
MRKMGMRKVPATRRKRAARSGARAKRPLDSDRDLSEEQVFCVAQKEAFADLNARNRARPRSKR